jgi:hypothetical protein
MARIDPRLLPLIDTLINSEADWLAFEILDAIRAGRPAEESEEEVREARDAVRTFRADKRGSPPRIAAKAGAGEELEGDDQIIFASTYVIDRISQAIEMSKESLRRLSEIVSRSEHQQDATALKAESQAQVFIQIEDSDAVSDQDRSTEATRRLPGLRSALIEWSRSVLHEEPQA